MATETIKFYDTELIAEQDGQNGVWVAIRPICEAIGIHTDKQVQRIKEDEILGPNSTVRYVLDAANRQFPMVCLPIQYIHGWLFSIDANRVSPDIKPRLILFKRECYDVLYNHFFGDGRTMRLDALREWEIIRDIKQTDITIRNEMKKRKSLQMELKGIQNRRAYTYHREPLHEDAEDPRETQRFLKQTQQSLELPLN